MNKKLIAGILIVLLSIAILTGCQSTAPSPDDAEVPDAPEVSAPVPAEEPSEEPSEEPKDERVVKEDYVFEGPGIIAPADYPESYKKEAPEQGSVQTITYNNGREEKHFNIYLPYGYESGSENYNVLYMMHGGNGRPEVYLQTTHASNFQSLIDNMIYNGDIDPIIVVAPTWNSTVTGMDTDGSHSGSGGLTEQFAETEFTEHVLPLVDGNFRTNANRDGRAFSGFSMGGVTTWYTFLHDLEHIRYFIPISGDCWALGETSGGSRGEETAAALANAVTSQGYTSEDFKIYCFAGTQDTAIPNLAPQIYALQENEMFVFGENTFFGTYPDGLHSDVLSRTYLYNALPNFWKS